MAAQPDVSIVVPVGSAAELSGLAGLQRTLGSIGDDPQVEILAVLHGRAPDGAVAWLSARAAVDRRLILLGEDWCNGAEAAPGVRPYAPRGVAWARNFGIWAAAAPLLALLDPGDVWLAGKLGAQRALHAGHPSLGFSFSDCLWIGPTGAGGGSALAAWPRFRARHGGHATPFLLGADALAQLFAEHVVIASTVVARTELLRELDGFAADLAAPEWDLWLRLAARAPVACLPEARAAVRRPEAAGAVPAPPGALAEIAARHAAAARRQDPASPRLPAPRRFAAIAGAAGARATLRGMARRLAEFARRANGRPPRPA